MVSEARHWRNVANEIEIEIVIERRADRRRWISHQKRMAIRWRTHNRFYADIGTGTRSVFDDKLLAKSLG